MQLMSKATLTDRSYSFSLNRAVTGLESSATLAINELVARKRNPGEEIIHLGFGQSSLPLHPKLWTALCDSAHRTEYASVLGTPELRNSIAGFLQRNRRVDVSSKEIIVGPGSKPLLYVLLRVLDGDLLLPTPSWVSYAPQAKLAGKMAIPVKTDEADRHQITPQALSAALKQAHVQGANPRILLLNSPSNPTGSMFDELSVAQIASWAKEHNICIISDEIYAELTHGWRKHVSPAVYYPEGCVITGGLSKSFSAGGWRLGYAAVPKSDQGEELMRALQAVASEIWSSVATPVQEAATIAFSDDPEISAYVKACAHLHGRVVNRMYETLVSLGVPCPRPAGAFYLYPNFAPWRRTLKDRGVSTDTELARYLLDKWHIATLPGSAFGDDPEALCLRLSTSMLIDKSPKELQESILCELTAQTQSHGIENSAVEKFVSSLQSLETAQLRFAELIGYLCD